MYFNKNDFVVLFAKYRNTDAKLFENLLKFAVKDVNFLYINKWYNQIDGVSMGKPLAQTIFMIHIENVIENYTSVKHNFYKRYVDEIYDFLTQRQYHPIPWFYEQKA